MVSYYNSAAMYRHQQAVAGNPSGPFHQTNSPMHSWYTTAAAAGYHQNGPMSGGHPGSYCGMQDDQQMWHHQHAAAVMFHNDYQDMVHGGGGGGGAMAMQQQHLQQMDTENQLPSPPITVSGSEMSSPGAGSGNISPPNNTNNQNTRPAPVRSPYEWIKKTSYQSQPNPGKTRTKDKYRVVYTDHQRVELEKEFYYSRYITIRRKAELAANLGLSERQVKIWFQNRRAKERKQVKKRDHTVYPKTSNNSYNIHHHEMADHLQNSEIIHFQNHHLLPDSSDVLAS